MINVHEVRAAPDCAVTPTVTLVLNVLYYNVINAIKHALVCNTALIAL